MSEPQRTCCICGLKENKSKLYRFVWNGTAAVKDLDQSMPGRGAYSCMNDLCLQKFLDKKKKWNRLFRL